MNVEQTASQVPKDDTPAVRPPMFSWREGRQGTGYETMMLVWSKRLRLDCCLIRYREGASIPPHRDPVKGGAQHYRFNVIVRPAKKGGELICEKSLFRLGPVNFFRPDLAEHEVKPVEKGVRYVFSIGWKR